MTRACAAEAETRTHASTATAARSLIRLTPMPVFSWTTPPDAVAPECTPVRRRLRELRLRRDRQRDRVGQQLPVGRRADERRPRAGQVADARAQRRVHVDVGVDA